MTNTGNYVDKVEQVGELLYDLAQIRGEGEQIIVRSDDERLQGLSISEIETIFGELSEDSGAFSGFQRIQTVDGAGTALTEYEMQIDALALRDYLIETYGKTETKSVTELQEEYLDKQVLYWLTFTKNGQLILNDKYLMHTLQYGSNSYEVFAYLFDHLNQEVTRDDIQAESKMEITRSLANTLDEAGFRGELKKLVKSSKGKVLLRDKITRGLLKELDVDQTLLEKQVQALAVLS